MSERVKLDWRVPAEEWQRFRDYVAEEFGGIEGYLGREAEAAMTEYIDADDYDGVEELVDRLVEAAGRRPSEKKISERAGAEDTTRVTARVEQSVKDEFREFVALECEEPPGQILARALAAYREGGRPDRLERKLERVVDDAEALLAEAGGADEDDDDDDGEDGLSAVERRTVAICNRLPPEQFTDDELVEAIRAQGIESEPTIEEYRERITSSEWRDVEPHPTNPDLWIPTERAEEIAPEGMPPECRKPVEKLDRGERVRRLQLEVGRRAGKREDGSARVRASDLREDVLDDEVARETTQEYIHQAGMTPGYRVEASGSDAWLTVDLEDLGPNEPELFERIIEYRDADAAGLLDGPALTTMTDFGASTAPTATDGGPRGGGR